MYEHPGALFFTAPDKDGLRTKFHLCPGCGHAIESGKHSHPAAKVAKLAPKAKVVACCACKELFVLPGAIYATVPDEKYRCELLHICPPCALIIVSVGDLVPKPIA